MASLKKKTIIKKSSAKFGSSMLYWEAQTGCQDVSKAIINIKKMNPFPAVSIR